MGSRFSTRAQVAVALALSLVAGTALHVFISSAVLRRALALQSQQDLGIAARSLARCVEVACEGAGPSCVSTRARTLGTADLNVNVVDEWKDRSTAGVASAPLRGGRGEVVVSPAVFEPSPSGRSQVGALLIAYAILGGLFTFILGSALLNRVIARPLDRLAGAAERIGRLELDDPLGGEAPTLGRLGAAFERMANSLKAERQRVTVQIAELERLNRQLAEARDSLVRTEKLATVGRLAAGVAHEVGNPLGAILGYLEIARSKAPPELADYFSRIDREVARIDRTVRELLDFSRPGPLDSAFGPVPLRAAVGAAVRLASVQKRLKHVAFDVEIPDGISVLAEAHHLSQVLVNVLLNAGDAMNGDGQVQVRARRIEGGQARRAGDPPPGPRVELSLADSGPGIAPADLARIFDPFFTTKEPGEGTGLGLSICYRIMEGFGGEIRAGNRPEGGAVFTLVFREPAPVAAP
ncbi:MAG: HAMP domain-containing protein [Deltaproteobacteria bacterium]|nr:HAMP domain-containing protein [Deltaproteobacteria bacterium]